MRIELVGLIDLRTKNCKVSESTGSTEIGFMAVLNQYQPVNRPPLEYSPNRELEERSPLMRKVWVRAPVAENRR